ncbi:DNA topoisomerase IV subunit A [Candidatus Finniella inopinata]|uniref:DNA topoisomerase 4 subunit A n=1 Tax=Candidatus Finniella inopinata TaxID=1696036 RepID=A0A4V2DZL9_9PROT|nr:DNA topoisomerase IV subunit A [Candidatus Finniella inopinata]RZI45517.1 DNA topoisomerase IV subunit A [Candidatus Finniella inopinata]
MQKETSTNITPIDFEQALHERYLAYALSTIMSRSLPDVRDGLKPVHRRLIYAMQQLRLNPTTGFKKCARVVGDVMGKFHPHGDAAIYGALVRLAQDFSVRYPLIEGQGNFGNIDGDGPAAMRYTEARLSQVAMTLMEGLEENAVDFRPTYDGEGEEPIVFPAAFPNLLANGATGIAVGMATSIPPHNLDEICQALTLLIDQPEASIEQILAVMPGPDFPTGGILTENADILLKAYETGRGSFRVRARFEVEEIKGGGYRIVITEVPYQVEKSKLIEKIANLLNEKKLPFLDDVIDESADDIRLVLQPKSRNVEPNVLMESLFRLTDLEVRIPLNMNALDGHNVPRVMSLKEVLQAFLDHRFVVQERRSRHRLEQIASRLEILAGYLVVYLNLDEVIQIIRDEDDPKAVLQERFSLTPNQVEAILNMRLRSLRKLQEIEIRQEFDGLEKEKKSLEQLLSSLKLQWKQIHKEIQGLRKTFGQETVLGRRRTTIMSAPDPVVVPLVDTIEVEDVTVVFSAKSWLRSVKGHVQTTPLTYKEGDAERFVLTAQTIDKLVLFASNGRFYTIGVDKIPRTRGHGEPIRLLVDLANTDEILGAFIVKPSNPDQKFLIAASDGRGFVIKALDTLAQTKLGKQVLTPAEGAVPKFCLPVTGDHVAVVGQNRKLLIFSVAELPVMNRGRGVTLQKYKDGGISDLTLFTTEQGLKWSRAGKVTTLTDMRPWQGKRASSGRLAPISFPRSNTFEE